MQSIGERLEEARKRKGISLREAAEATKIRGDFLGYFEQNKFDFELPELYKRGFIKNYARYLKLDPEKIITDYSSQLLSNTRIGGKKGGAELFGQIEIKKQPASPTAPESTSQAESGYGHISSSSTSTNEGQSEREGDEENDKTFYLKIGLVFVGTLTLVFVIFGLIKAILSSGDEPAAEPELSTPTEITEPAAPTISDAAANNELKLIASGTVYVLVKQQSDNAILYRDTMSAGETVSITKEGPVDILFTAGENIVIEQAGERMRPNSDGTAKITLP